MCCKRPIKLLESDAEKLIGSKLKTPLLMYTFKFFIEGDCDFEESLTSPDCLWNNVNQGDDFDWTENSGGTPSLVTGPSVDRKGSSAGLFKNQIDNSLRSGNDDNKTWARRIHSIFRR